METYLFECLPNNGLPSCFPQRFVHLECFGHLVFGLDSSQQQAKYCTVFYGRIGTLREVWQHGVTRVATERKTLVSKKMGAGGG